MNDEGEMFPLAEIHRRSCTLRYRRPHQDGPLERPLSAPKGQGFKAKSLRQKDRVENVAGVSMRTLLEVKSFGFDLLFFL